MLGYATVQRGYRLWCLKDKSVLVVRDATLSEDIYPIKKQSFAYLPVSDPTPIPSLSVDQPKDDKEDERSQQANLLIQEAEQPTLRAPQDLMGSQDEEMPLAEYHEPDAPEQKTIVAILDADTTSTKKEHPRGAKT